MQKNCEVYIDPEEDEVFFGSVSEKEKNICAKLLKQSGSNDESNLNKSSVAAGGNFKAENDKKVDVKESDQESADKKIKISLNDVEDSFTDSYHSFDKSQVYLNNTCVEVEHNYSTPVKQKIDKTILATPNSIVKADKDGGFLKVLSEIAIVKAEVEADKEIDESLKEDEDKENKIIPEINIIEATPEKLNVTSPVMTNTQFIKSKGIYTSKIEESAKSENSPTENFENSQNLKNICMSYDDEVSACRKGNILANCKNSTGVQNQSINLIDFNETVHGLEERISTDFVKTDYKNEVLRNQLNDSDKQEVTLNKTEGIALTEKKENQFILDKNSQNEFSNLVMQNKDLVNFSNEPHSQGITEKTNISNEIFKLARSEEVEVSAANLPPSPLNTDQAGNCFETDKEGSIIERKTISDEPQLQAAAPNRFSKEAKEVIEIIKKSAMDDTLNYTIQPIDVENIENSFLAPEGNYFLYETIQSGKTVNVSDSENTSVGEKALGKSPALQEGKPGGYPKTIEKERHKMTPVLSCSKIPPVKYFSEKKNNQQNTIRCVKKLPIEDDCSTLCAEKKKEGKPRGKEPNLIPGTSKIPILGLKTTKMATNERIAFPLAIKTTPLKTPKNKKFNNIESPIGAYIHNKPTSLVQNVKPNAKKDCAANLWNRQVTNSETKIREKTPVSKTSTRLPFVEYKSAVSYEVEKRPESRLPRLAPTVQKLIGTNSPKILKHQGRFYVKTPRKVSSDDCTMIADTNEVSLIVSHSAQKSIKKMF